MIAGGQPNLQKRWVSLRLNIAKVIARKRTVYGRRNGFGIIRSDPTQYYKYKRSDGEEDWSSYCRLGRADLM